MIEPRPSEGLSDDALERGLRIAFGKRETRPTHVFSAFPRKSESLFGSRNAQEPRRYRIGDELGRGGVGAVFTARDNELRRELAVKVLLDQHRDNAHMRRRFVEEAQISGQLQHPGIVPVHEIGELEDGRVFFSMKLVQGRTLAELLSERTDAAADRQHFLGIFERVAQTVAYAHARGVIHRDLKPGNVMVGAFGEVHVVDWGLAKVVRRDAGSVEATSTDAEAPPVETLRDDAPVAMSMAGTVMGT
ncbi:MAG: serine/threonine protein kinase, partial [Planctomycetes bacterium]|nr:serine/threonine protein kinase [Planctomycetota bacterium]